MLARFLEFSTARAVARQVRSHDRKGRGFCLMSGLLRQALFAEGFFAGLGGGDDFLGDVARAG